jgi:hypothetical protein
VLKVQLELLQQMNRSNNMYHCIVIIAYVIIYNHWYVSFAISWGTSNVPNLVIFCPCVLWTLEGCRLSSSWMWIVMGILLRLPFPFWREVDKITLITARCDDYIWRGCCILPGRPTCLHIPIIVGVSCV